MKRFILAFQFLTIFPVKASVEATPEALSGSMAYYPLVGAVQGLILVVASFAFSALFPWSVTAGLLVLVLVLTNGGLHLDGFADTVDGVAGGRTPEERMRIMKDSATGAIGVVFVVLLLLLKYLAIKELPADARVHALFIFPLVGRWAMVPMAYMAPYARKEGGLGESFAANSLSTLVKATLVTAVLSAAVLGVLSLLILLLVWVTVYFFTAFFKRKLGGVTGDVFGFQSETAELFFLLSFIALANVMSKGL